MDLVTKTSFLYIFGILVKHFYNLCLLNIEVHFYFGFILSINAKFVSTDDVFLLSQTRLATTFFCSQNYGIILCVTRPLFRIWVQDHTGKVKLQFIVSAFFKMHVGGMSLFNISFVSVQLLIQ